MRKSLGRVPTMPQTFLPIEELNNPLICVIDFSVDKGTTQRFAKQTSSRLLVGI